MLWSVVSHDKKNENVRASRRVAAQHGVITVQISEHVSEIYSPYKNDARQELGGANSRAERLLTYLHINALASCDAQEYRERAEKRNTAEFEFMDFKCTVC